jgi:ATP-dependent exoDNAse (exonuclease V) beta subunit
MPSNKNEKTEQLKAEIDKWIQEFSTSQKKFERFDVYSGEQLSLGFLAYKDDKGQTTVLISIHGQKPTNSVSFPVSALEDITQITRLLEKHEELFKYVEKYEENIKSTKKKKNLLE